MVRTVAGTVKAMSPVRRRSVSQSIADDLLQLIGTGEFRPGDRLPTEQGLMERYGVGRNTVREAVQVLVGMRLVESRPGRGTTILASDSADAGGRLLISQRLTDEAIDDLYEFREVIEVEIAGRAARLHTAEDLEASRRALEHFVADVREGLPNHQSDIRFHLSLAAAAHNAVFHEVLQSLQGILSEVRRQTQSVPRAADIAVREHRVILDAIERGDVDGARSAMTQHIGSAKWALGEARRRPPGEAVNDE